MIDGPLTTTEQNKQLVREFHERLWAHGDLSAIEAALHPDAVTHWGDFAANTIDAVRADAERYFLGFTEVETTIADLIAEGDRVVLNWSTSGLHSGPYGTHAATGRRIVMTGIDIFRLADGKIVEAWSLWDGLDVYRQLGLLPDELQ